VKCEILSSETVFNEYILVEKTNLRWEKFDGNMSPESIRFVVRRGDSVGVVPVCRESGRIVLVKQFRFPAVRDDEDGYLWEIPAGMLDRDEEPVETAARELFEEIGVSSEEIESLTSYYLSPGLLDERMHLYLAQIGECPQIGAAGGNPDEHEDLLVQAFSKDEILAMIAQHEIIDAKSLAGLLYYFSVYLSSR